MDSAGCICLYLYVYIYMHICAYACYKSHQSKGSYQLKSKGLEGFRGRVVEREWRGAMGDESDAFLLQFLKV